MINLLDSEGLYDKMDGMRRERSWSIYELAKRAGVTSNALYHWRDRKSSPTLALLDGVCDAFGISVVAFLTEEEDLMALTDEQKEILRVWDLLPAEHRAPMIEIIKTIQEVFGH